VDAGGLYYVARRLKAYAEAALGDRDGQADAMPPAHQMVLGCVLAAPGSSIGDIARSAGLAQSAVSTAVAALRDVDLVFTSADPDDRRMTRVSPSARLSRWAAGHLAVDAETVLAPLLASRPERDRRRVLEGLAILHDAFTRTEGKAP
jgi:DNA-binding MarR family transcriptional regulator